MKSTQAAIQARWPELHIGIDVVELRSYHYHTGLMYAVYAPNRAAPLAQGGRYDGIGEHFGRARPATGFSCDLYALTAGQVQKSQSFGCTKRHRSRFIKGNCSQHVPKDSVWFNC